MFSYSFSLLPRRFLYSRKAISQINNTSDVIRFAGTLVIAEPTPSGTLNAGTLNTITAARKLSSPEGISCLIANDSNTAAIAQQLAGIADVKRVLVAENAVFKGLLSESITPLIMACQAEMKFTHILASASAFGKSLIPRLAAKLDVTAISDVMGILAGDTFVRSIYAGNAVQTLKNKCSTHCLTIRGTSFEPSVLNSNTTKAEIIPCPGVSAVKNSMSKFISQELSKSERPELASAKIVISGGRGMKNGENFQLLYALADKMGAAVGASRAAVDAGFVPNDMQIGQTGKIVAPELYIAVAISGAIQHLAGMKDSKVIVAINKDPEAPIFHVADYGLVEDLFKAVPEMTSMIK